MTVLLVALGAAVGAPLRYLVDTRVQARHSTGFPWGTLSANVLACLVLGFVTGAVTSSAFGPGVQALLGTGLCGSLSTYSTFSSESLRLAEQGSRVLALANVVVSVVAGLGAVVVGAAVAQAAWG